MVTVHDAVVVGDLTCIALTHCVWVFERLRMIRVAPKILALGLENHAEQADVALGTIATQMATY